MFVHVVMWNLKENYTNMDKATIANEIKNKLLQLKNEISEIRFMEVGINAHFHEKNHDIILITKFENLQAMQAYANHPKHQKVVAFIKEVITDRAAVDYEL